MHKGSDGEEHLLNVVRLGHEHLRRAGEANERVVLPVSEESPFPVRPTPAVHTTAVLHIWIDTTASRAVLQLAVLSINQA